MASTDLSVAAPASAHPTAKPGFGKRVAAGQPGRRPEDFAHLPVREAYLAGFIDNLPEGAAIDVKTLAKTQPLYGQQACRSALRELSRVGHLRRVGGSLGEGRPQHVTRTYSSRRARTEEWWTEFLDGRQDVGCVRRGSDTQPTGAAATTSARSQRSEAYEALADLGRRDPRLVLSATECAALEESAAEWLRRGIRGPRFAYAMTSGLPPTVHSPAGLLRRRLADKLPPEPAAAAADSSAESPAPRLRLECTDCGVPGTVEALPGGLCRRCREEPEPERMGLTADQVRRFAAQARDAVRTAARARSVRSPRPRCA
ncbi:MAG: hypothetical protein ACRDP3_20730 [Streptomyces sp.]|uniref:hypothetical protein n=1 Tax=Streptomyces sp. TaxID=1931 RepID=UPI003D6B01AD